MTKEFETTVGRIVVRNAMFESEDGTTLYEGIELKDEDGLDTTVHYTEDISELFLDLNI